MIRPALLILVAMLPLVPGRFGDDRDRRPNFLFILTDDQAPETLSAYGNTVCQTPHIDRIENIDRQVGRVLERLEAMGELEHTYVIFTSDHGIAVGRHGLAGKQNLYEHTWRVPFLVRGPGIEAGSRASGYVYLLDVLPTLCDLAGIELPAAVEGRSMRPVLEGRAERVREVLYGVYCGGSKPGMRAVKTDGWKLIQYDLLDGGVRETQLFDLRANPHELLAEHHDPRLVSLLGNEPRPEQVDLAELPEHAAVLAEMQALLRAEMERLGDPYELTQ